MTLTPTAIHLHKAARELELSFSDGFQCRLPAEYLRVHSPSAEVRGHGGAGAVLVFGKQNVAISTVEMVGQYALKIVFDDGHATGLYSWQYLHELGAHQEQKWTVYLQALAAAGKSHADTPCVDAGKN